MNDGQIPSVTVAAKSPRGTPENTSPKMQSQTAREDDVITFDESSDTESDVPMSASEDEMVDLIHEETFLGTIKDSVLDLTRDCLSGSHENTKKRKASVHGAEILNATKKTRSDVRGQSGSKPLRKDWSLIPKEYWQHIFTFVPPQTLGVVLQVNKYFNTYLVEDSSWTRFVSAADVRLEPLRPDEIWRASRKAHYHKLPGPLRGRTELEMWRLLRSSTCQFCGKVAQRNAPARYEKSSSRPGSEGVEVIWAFAIKSCGPCLIASSTKEIDLILSPTVPSVLLPALPFVLSTSDMQIFSPHAIARAQDLGNMALTKIFHSNDVNKIQKEFEYVKSLGTGAAEEWLKGLDERGKKLRIDADRWEKWKSSGGILQLEQLQVSSVSRTPKPHTTKSQSNEPLIAPEVGESSSHATTTLYQKEILSRLAASDLPKGSQLMLPLKLEDNDSFSVLESSTQPSQQIQGLPQAKRTLQEVIELKAARRAEIERRALLLDPPLQPSVLAHIPSFQAALQIITPLGDNAWELLKPRLLLQRTDAEQREMHNQTMAQNSPSFEEQPKDTKELMDKDWDDAQAPLRARISMYADELIHDSWDDGGKVTKESSPRFAAEVLLEVRQKFYAIIAKEASAARVACREPIRDPPQGPFTQKLTLENMKWLFEVKVKPYTDPFRKELFLCRGCDDSTKAYGFEGVVQHYAAKHTKSMSVGNIVVYWRSEWPEIPPFHPDPVAKSTQFHNPIASVHLPPVQSQQYNQHRHPQPPLYGTAAAGQFGSTFPSHHGHPGNPQQYATYRPPGIYTQPQIPHISSYPQPPVPFHHAPGMPHNAVPPPFGVQAVSRYSHQPGSGFSGPPGALHYNHSYDSYYPIQQADYPNPPEDFQSERMRVQLEALAHNSRDIWMATAGIKNLPGYIRVYVCLHHLASRYRSQFAESPPLTMFLDGLANHKEMRPVRNVNELMCKACHLGLDNHVPDEKERTVFSLPQLVNHFQQRHIEPLQSSGGQLLDWTIDMVYLPEVTSLSELKAMTGMDTHKYGLITEAFPQSAFQENPSGQAPSTQFVPPQVSRGEVYDFEPRSGYLSIQNNGPLAPTSAGDHVYSNSGGGQSSVPNHDTPLAVPPQADGGQSQIMQSQTQGPHIISVAPGRPMAHDPSQTSGSNFRRNSPDWPVGKQRRKLSRKEHRAQSKQEAKLRRGNTKNGPGIKSRADSVDTEEDKEAEAEAQRQENAIRAMWEADRKATARVASTTTTLQAQGRDSPSGFPSRFLAPSVQVPTPAQNSVSQTAIDLRSRESSSRSVTDSEDDLFAGLESHLAQHNAARPVPVTAPVQQPSQMGVSLRAPETHSVSHNFDGHSHGHGHDRDLRADRSQSPHYEEPKLWYHPEYRERSPRIPAADRTYINQTRTEIEGVLPDHRAYADGYKETVPQDRRVIYTTEPHLHGISAIQHADRPPSHSAALVHYAQELPRRPVSSVQYTDPRLDHSVRPAPSNVAYEMYERVLVRESNGDEYYIERPVRRQPDPVYLRREEERPRYREPMAYGGYEHNDRRREAFYESFRRQEDSNDRRTTAGPAPIRPRSPQRYVTYDEAHRAAVESYDEYDPRFPGAASSFGPPRHVQYQ